MDQTELWHRLKNRHDYIKNKHLREMFAEDSDRARRYSLTVGDLFVDYSKNRIDDSVMSLLFDMARDKKVEQLRDAMYGGQHVNSTEDRPALHVALRNPATSHVLANGEDIMPDIKRTIGKMGAFSEAIRSRTWLGHSGKPIVNVINIGIGGQHLGPSMAVDALRFFSDRNINVQFISNVDPANFKEVIRGLDPEETLFIINSKTFTTDETMTNATSARIWIANAMGDMSIDKHFVACSSAVEKAGDFGISSQNVFEFWDFVGGRYSLCSAGGLALMVSIGAEHFQAMLQGFHAMDEHFRTAPLEQNMPVILALISAYYISFYETQSEAIVPYSYYLEQFPAYMQQTNMESNGKSVTKNGEVVSGITAPVIWGAVGTNGQHAFFQHLHQSPVIAPVDFIGFKNSNNDLGAHHRKLLANMIAQAEALAFGRTAEQLHEDGVIEDLIAHKAMPGCKPSNVILGQKLTPSVLGQLIALYEHKIFVQGALWGINSFDQWGVELGKKLAVTIKEELKDPKKPRNHDASTEQLITKVIGG